MVAVLWFGGREVLGRQGLSAEDFVRFLIILFAILEPIKSIGALNNNVQIALAAATRIFEIGDDPAVVPERADALAKTAFSEAIQYEQVCFRYGPEEDWVLSDFSFRMGKHESLALVGSSGAGKTTVARLLPRFYDPERGRILMDGVDLRELRLRDLRRLIGVVSQEVLLFNASVAENIAYARPEASPEEIREAARLAHALDFIEDLPQGFATRVGEKGLRLSGGQRQRISIARAVLLDPAILIFDEATSSLDSESERLIQDAIARLLADRTVLMIAHRLSTVMDCDRILVMEQGRLLDQGKHAELLERSERYRQLCRLQFGELPRV
jgi:subfamily B ATP-binding cassette protein MsbA